MWFCGENTDDGQVFCDFIFCDFQRELLPAIPLHVMPFDSRFIRIRIFLSACHYCR